MSDQTTELDRIEVEYPTKNKDEASEQKSPAELVKRHLPEKLKREFELASDDHPLVKSAGTKAALQSQTPPEVLKLLSDELYVETDVFFREWLQNHIAAVTREAKRRIKNEYGPAALYYTVEDEWNGETREIMLPRKPKDIIDHAKQLGYAPSIEFIVDHDDGSLTTRDNGIGITTGEAMTAWLEPAISGSGTDLSSAGNKGIGSLTWVTISDLKEAAMLVKTRTLREQMVSGDAVPQRDRDGYVFYSYFGGILAVPGEVEDGFYGTEFKIPIGEDVDADEFFDAIKQYTDVLPTTVSWVEIKNGQRNEEELISKSFLDRYPDTLSVTLDRPGEFTLVLGKPDTVEKRRKTDDTFLLDNPIDRNTSWNQKLDTLYNDHLQIHNEQGLIIDGPHRGEYVDDVDELSGKVSDIERAIKEDAEMPDIPLPQPVASRDSLKNDESHERFFEYLDHVAQKHEKQLIYDYLDEILDADSPEAAIDVVREHGDRWSFLNKAFRKHAPYGVPSRLDNLANWVDTIDSVAFDLSEGTEPALLEHDELTKPSDVGDKLRTEHHPDADLLRLIKMLSQEVDVATADTEGDPNLKENRRSSVLLGNIIGTEQRWPVFIGATLNEDRCEVIFHEENYPNAVVIKTRKYNHWQNSPIDVSLVKNVPFNRSEADETDEDWHIPQTVHDRNTKSKTPSQNDSNGEWVQDATNIQERRVKIRCTENSAVDYTTTIGKLMKAADSHSGGQITAEVWTGKRTVNKSLNHDSIIVFPTTSDTNISDHYHMSEHAVLVRCNASESRALLGYDCVYTMDEYIEETGSMMLTVYDPFTNNGWEARLDSILEDIDRTAFVSESSTTLWNAIAGNEICGVEPTHEHYDAARKEVLQSIKVGDNKLKRTDGVWYPKTDLPVSDDKLNRWVAVRLPMSKSKLSTITSHVAAADYRSDTPADLFSVTMESLNRNENFSTVRVRRLEQTVKRAIYPHWSDEAWNRLNESYRGPESYEKELLRACRDLGIDPTDHPDGKLERAIVHLATRCDDK